MSETITGNSQHAPKHGNRKPFAGMVAFFILLVLVGIAFLIPKLRHKNQLEAEAKAASGPPVVLAAKLASGDRGGHMELPATVQAFEQTPIFARTSGYLKDRYVDIGDHVRKGQLLAVIDDPQTEQQLMQARAALAQNIAQLAQARSNATLSKVTNERWQSLVKEGVVAKQDADTKQAQAGADDATVAALGLESPWDLTGLYHGTPLTQRSVGDTVRMPDLIFLYRQPILAEWIDSGEDLSHLVASVLIHEIGHHFGFSDADIEALEAEH